MTGKTFWRQRLIVAASIVALALAACVGPPPTGNAPLPQSDSSHLYSGGKVPVDDRVYTISGVVIADVESLTRQTQPAGGAIYGSAGVTYGSFFGPQFDGKGFVRLLVKSSDSPLAPEGSVVILKTSDTKAVALVPSDEVTFKCRADYEAVASVRDYTPFTEEIAGAVATWELDYCRMINPIIGQIPQ